MTAIGDGMVEALHADAVALASGRELAPAVQARVIGQIGLALCQLNAAVVSKEDIAELAESTAKSVVSEHAEVCAKKGALEGAASGSARAVTPTWVSTLKAVCAAIRPVAWPLGLAASAWAFSPHAPALISAIIK